MSGWSRRARMPTRSRPDSQSTISAAESLPAKRCPSYMPVFNATPPGGGGNPGLRQRRDVFVVFGTYDRVDELQYWLLPL